MTSTPSGGNVPPGTCPTCGAQNTPGSRFCERCGTRLPPSSREATAPTPAQPTDATLTFERIPEPNTRNEHDAPAPPARQPASPTEEVAAASESTAPERTASAPAPRDAPTVSFELPILSTPLSDEERSAPTLAFDLPQLPPADDAPATAAQAATQSTANDPFQAESAPDLEQPDRSNWNYQPWKPQKPEERSAIAPAPTEHGETRRSISLPPPGDTPSPTEPTQQEFAPLSQPPPQPPPSQQPTSYPQQGGGAYSSPPAATPQAPGWYGPPPGAPTPQGNITYPTPGALPPPSGQAGPGGYAAGTPSYGYPQGEAGYPQAAATAWAPPNANAYPSPGNSGSNRTLWIILGVVGGLLLLCAMICVLVILVGAVGASSTSSVATSVATATRP